MIAWLVRLFTHGSCECCRRRKCPKEGSWFARRRAYIYCDDCINRIAPETMRS